MKKENQLAVQQQTTAPVTFNFFDPQQFETMQRVCKMFANSELVPEIYKASATNPEAKAIANCMIAVSMSMRIGADPLMIMQNMIIIHGRPSWSSKFLIATVNTSGRFNPLQFRFTEMGMLGKVPYTEYVWSNRKREAVTKEFDGTKIMDVECVAYTTVKGSDEVLESAPISLRLAIKEGWYTKNRSKWQTMPRQMLMYRAASFWTNVYAPELSMGMKTEDEILDIIDVDYEDVTKKVDREKEKNANKQTMGFDVNENESEESKDDKSGDEVEQKQDESNPENKKDAVQEDLFNEKKKKPGF